MNISDDEIFHENYSVYVFYKTTHIRTEQQYVHRGFIQSRNTATSIAKLTDGLTVVIS